MRKAVCVPSSFCHGETSPPPFHFRLRLASTRQAGEWPAPRLHAGIADGRRQADDLPALRREHQDHSLAVAAGPGPGGVPGLVGCGFGVPARDAADGVIHFCESSVKADFTFSASTPSFPHHPALAGRNGGGNAAATVPAPARRRPATAGSASARSSHSASGSPVCRGTPRAASLLSSW